MKNPLSLKNRAWSASIINVFVMLVQLHHLWKAQTAEGVSLIMLIGFVYIQVTFAQVGYKTKEWALFWGMTFSAIITTAVVILVIYFQYFKL